MITRQTIHNKISQILKSQELIDAAWISGSEAFRRTDEWSGIDIRILVDLNYSNQIFEAIEYSLAKLYGIDKFYAVPADTYPNHRQRFYSLKESSPYHVTKLTFTLFGKYSIIISSFHISCLIID